MKNKLFTLLFAIMAGVGTMFAENGTCGENLTWTLTDGVLTISGTGEMSDFDYYDLKYSPWDSESSSITSVVINEGVTSIGIGAFWNCSGLTTIEIPNSVTSIGNYAFYNCIALTSIEIPNSVTSVGDRAFYDCIGLNSVTIGNGVTSIEDYTFAGCSALTSVTIGNGVTSIGNYAFAWCYALTSIEIPNGVTNIGQAAFEACSALTTVVIPNSVTSIGNWAFSGCTALTSLEIPNSVTSIGNYAFSSVPNIIYNGTAEGSPWGARSANGFVDGYLVFEDNSKTKLLSCSSAATGEISIPETVKIIGESAFSGCTGLTSIEISNSVTSIGGWAFSGCSGLTSVEIPNSVTSIGNYAFNGCTGLTSVVWNARHCADINNEIFPYENSITSFIFGDEVEYIPAHLCANLNQLQSVSIPSSVTSIGYGAFSGCSGLTSVEIPISVTSIGDWAFSGCSGLTSVEIPNSVTSIGDGAFEQVLNIAYIGTAEGSPWGAKCVNGFVEGYLVYEDNSKTKLVACSFAATGAISIPETVKSIGDQAFLFCTALTSIAIPNSVSSIGDRAFVYCTALTSIDVAVDNPNYCSEDGVLFNKDKTILLQCPIGNSRTSYSIPNSITSIGYDAFAYCSGLTSIEIPNSVISIGSGAFTDCSALTSIEIPNNVTSIGYAAFAACSGATSLTIGTKVEDIGDYAFAGCTQLEEITCNATNVPKINETTFNIVDNKQSIHLYVPENLGPAYIQDIYWKEFDIQLIPAQTAIDQVYDQMRKCENEKILRNGQLFILRDHQTYTLTGQEIR